jgi:hypothetical protein
MAPEFYLLLTHPLAYATLIEDTNLSVPPPGMVLGYEFLLQQGLVLKVLFTWACKFPASIFLFAFSALSHSLLQD